MPFLDRMWGAKTTLLIGASIVRYVAERRVGWLTGSMRLIAGLGSDGLLLVVVLITALILHRQTPQLASRVCASRLRHRCGSTQQGHQARRRSHSAASGMGHRFRKWVVFPSGHATHSAAVYGGIPYLATRIRAVGRRMRAAETTIARGESSASSAVRR
jgi:membrane-associated phospholipid phosphatase